MDCILVIIQKSLPKKMRKSATPKGKKEKTKQRPIR